MPNAYLDHQAATPVLPEVLDAMMPYFSASFGNASSLHGHGLRARDALAKAREQMAGFIHASVPEDIIFTSDGTESINLAIKGIAFANQRRGNHIVTSAIEHPAVLGSLEFLEKQGFTFTRVGVDAEGRVDAEAIRAAVDERTILIVIHHVNHDIGTVQPVKVVAEIGAERGIPVFVDAEASAGWLALNVQELGVDLLSFSPHRFYSPKGVGVLYRSRRARLNGILHGGSQEGGRRAGTENIPAIVGAGVAGQIGAEKLETRIEHTAWLQRRLWNGLRERVPYLKLNGPEPGPDRISTNLNVSPEFLEGEGVLLMLDARGIAVASGTSCVSKSLKVSHVLAAIGVEHSIGLAAVLLSLGEANTDAEIDYVLETFPQVVSKLRGMSPTWDEFQRGTIHSSISPHPVAVSAKS